MLSLQKGADMRDVETTRLAKEIVFSRIKTFTHEAFTERMVGFALCRAWVYVVFFNSAMLVISNDPVNVLDLIYIISLFALVFMLVVLGCANERCESIMRSKIGRFIPAVLSAIGTAALPAAGLADLPGITALGISAIFTGLGSGLLLLFWGKAYSQVGGPQTAAETSVAFILATLLVPIFVLSPFVMQIIVVTVLPFASLAILLRELKASEKQEHQDKPLSTQSTDQDAESREQTKEVSSQWKLETVGLDWKRLLLKLVLSSGIFGIIVSIMTSVFSGSTSFGFNLMLPLSAFVAGSITLCVLFFSRRLELAFTYRPVLVLMSLGCCLLPFLNDSGNIAYFLTMSGYLCFEIMNWVMLSDICFRFNLPAYRVFGFGRAAISGGVFIGALLGRYLNTHFVFDLEMSAALSFAMIFVLIIVYTFTLTERDVAKITRQRARIPIASDEGSPDEHSLTLEEKVMIIAEQHDITGRGVEVLVLLAKGRTGTRIEQELYMSRGTVNTHLRRLYQKLGIHTKQEFLDMLESL